MSHRFAYALIHDNILTLGHPDPRGNHLRLTPTGISLHTPSESTSEDLPWTTIRSVTPSPPLAHFRPPAWLSLPAAVISAYIGLEWEPTVSDIPIRITSETTGTEQLHEFTCTGFIAHGYRRSQCDAIQSALHLLIRDERARALLADPRRFLATVQRASITEESSEK